MRVINVLFDDRFGGMASRVIQVAKALRAQDVETTLCLPQGEGNTGAIAAEKGLPIRRVVFSPIPSFGKLRRLVPWLLMLPFDVRRFSHLYRRERPDLVHVNGAFFIPAAIASKLSRTPLVWHMNDTIVPRSIAPLFGMLVNRTADWVILGAKAAGVHYGIRHNKCSVVYSPVDTALYGRAKRRALPSGESPARIGILANWTPVKGIRYFLKAAALIKKELGGNLEIVMAGAKLSTQKAYTHEIEYLITGLGLEKDVEDFGFVESVVPVLSRLDVLVSTSLSEACPLAVLEAMASRVPVVATDVGGVREILTADPERPAGLIVQPKDTKSIADAVLNLLANPVKAEAMGDNGRRIAERFFSVDSSAKEHLKVYETVAGVNKG